MEAGPGKLVTSQVVVFFHRRLVGSRPGKMQAVPVRCPVGQGRAAVQPGDGLVRYLGYLEEHRAVDQPRAGSDAHQPEEEKCDDRFQGECLQSRFPVPGPFRATELDYRRGP